jgi:endonuclease G
MIYLLDLFIKMKFILTVLLISYGLSICDDVFYKHKFPEIFNNDKKLCKKYYFIAYNEDTLCPDFVSEFMTYERMKELQGGRKNFMLDDELEDKQTSPNSKIFSSTINRGHLIPSYSSSWDKTNDSEWYYCYMMSNICPQYHKFNQIEWKNLENEIVTWILQKEKSLYVITGVIYKDRQYFKKKYGTGIPDYFFKIICDPTNKESVGFIGTNNNKLDGKTYEFHKVNDIMEKLNINILEDCNNAIVNPEYWWKFNMTYDGSNIFPNQ